MILGLGLGILRQQVLGPGAPDEVQGRVTEEGDVRVTEEGDTRVEES
jgi:hypothetical protein